MMNHCLVLLIMRRGEGGLCLVWYGFVVGLVFIRKRRERET